MARTPGAKNKPKTQEELNAQFEAAQLSEKCKVSFIQICINEFITIRYNLPDNLLKEFVKDFTDTLQAKAKTRESVGANFAYELLARSFDGLNRMSKGGKKGMAARWNKKDGGGEPETGDTSPF